MVQYGGFLVERGRFGDAEPMLRKSADLLREQYGLGDPVWLRAANNLVYLYVSRGEYDRAQAEMSRVYEGYLTGFGPDAMPTIRALGNLAYVTRHAGDLDHAEALYREVIERAEAAGGPEDQVVQTQLNNLAVLLVEQERYEEALPLHDRVFELRTAKLGPDHADTLLSAYNVGMLHLNAGQVDAAEQVIREMAARKFSTLPPGDLDVIYGWHALGRLEIAKGQSPARAIFFLKRAVSLLQAIRRDIGENPAAQAGFVERWASTYEHLQSLLVREGRFAEAEAVGNMRKEAEYFAFVRGTIAAGEAAPVPMSTTEDGWSAEFGSWVDQPNALYRELQELRRTSNPEPEMIAALEAAHDAAYARYRDRVGEFLDTARNMQDPEIREEAQNLSVAASERLQAMVTGLGDDVALLQIAAFDDALHFFLITPDAFLHRTHTVPRSEVLEAVFQARETIRDGGLSGFAGTESHLEIVKEEMQRLHALLLEPVENELQAAGTKTLMLNLQGRLRYVPFAALHNGREWLAERYATVLFSPAAFSEFEGETPQLVGTAFGLSREIEGFSPLPAVPRELEAVMTGPDGAGVLEGDFAINEGFTRAALEDGLSRARPILHIASHFEMQPGDAGESFLVLGDGSRLTLADINRSPRLRFRDVALVTLSACKTGLGGEGSGIEIDGLGALIQNKGADSVLATLWSVVDETTADFMVNFYANMGRDRMTKAAAMQAAQRKMIESTDHADPWFWAPYILMGDWQ
ncbi:CHAT domain-containing protein [Qipengyuania flava]|nr:CHAT domain-containing protein [Qipengyuania flava]